VSTGHERSQLRWPLLRPPCCKFSDHGLFRKAQKDSVAGQLDVLGYLLYSFTVYLSVHSDLAFNLYYYLLMSFYFINPLASLYAYQFYRHLPSVFTPDCASSPNFSAAFEYSLDHPLTISTPCLPPLPMNKKNMNVYSTPSRRPATFIPHDRIRRRVKSGCPVATVVIERSYTIEKLALVAVRVSK
jgi:hypothetical protein